MFAFNIVRVFDVVCCLENKCIRVSTLHKGSFKVEDFPESFQLESCKSVKLGGGQRNSVKTINQLRTNNRIEYL